MLIAKPTNPRVSTVLLRENALNNMRFLNPCKFDIQSLIPVRESVVVDAELMENRRLEVPDVKSDLSPYYKGNRRSYSAVPSLEVQLCAQLGEATKLNR